MAIEFTDASAHEAIESGAAVVIDFWATWCGPCMAMGPVVEQLAGEYADKDVKIGKYNIEDQSDLATEYRVMAIPTILFFKDGKMIRDLRLSGSQSIDTLREHVDRLLAL